MTTAFSGDDSVDRIKGLLKVSTNAEGFFQERHIKLGPLDFPADGIALCAADCPKECITIVHYTDEQLQAQVEAALAENPGEKILGFVCHWCALGGAGDEQTIGAAFRYIILCVLRAFAVRLFL